MEITEEEYKRLKKVEHLAWHLAESTEHDMTNDVITVDHKDFYKMCDVLPEDHPVMNNNTEFRQHNTDLDAK